MSNSVIGHEWVIDQLKRAYHYQRIRHAYLFLGPDNIGKTTLARWLAQLVNCLTPRDTEPCGECRNCRLIAANGHPDLMLVESEHVGATLKIDQIRDIQHHLTLRPYEAHYKIIIIRRFHEAQPQAQDALLKTLEEPSEFGMLLLTASSGASLLSTILSRSQVFNLRPLSLHITQHALREKWQLNDFDAQKLSHLSGGRLGWAVQALQNNAELEFRDEVLGTLEKILTLNRVGRFQVAEQLSNDSRGDRANLYALLAWWQTYWRDVLLSANQSTAALTNVDRQAAIRDLARLIGPDKAHQTLEATRRSGEYLQRNANTRLCLEVLLLEYPYV